MKKILEHLGLLRKSATESPTSDQPSQTSLETSNQKFSESDAQSSQIVLDPAAAEIVATGSNPSAIPNLSEKNAQHQDPAMELKFGTGKPPTFGFRRNNGAATITMHENRIVRYDTERYGEIFGKPLDGSGIWFYDPQCDEPLMPLQEKCMKQMGPVAYLQWICQEYRLSLETNIANEYDAMRAARKAVRSLPQYAGEKFIQ